MEYDGDHDMALIYDQGSSAETYEFGMRLAVSVPVLFWLCAMP